MNNSIEESRDAMTRIRERNSLRIETSLSNGPTHDIAGRLTSYGKDKRIEELEFQLENAKHDIQLYKHTCDEAVDCATMELKSAIADLRLMLMIALKSSYRDAYHHQGHEVLERTRHIGEDSEY